MVPAKKPPPRNLPGATGIPKVIGSRTGPSRIKAAVIEKKTSVLVSKLDKDVSASDLRDYLQATFGEEENISIEEQTVRSGDYRSYRVEIRLRSLDRFLTSSHWPENVVVRKFRFFRQKTKPA